MATKVRDLIRTLEQDGWFIVRTREVIASFITGPRPERLQSRVNRRRTFQRAR
ncbi:MAG TPA: hypothetical protein VLI90_09275 [Tepidisphaeraceae bacterium]|nr:hypothetical protein [Tepidisphaeraceae bacterium]